MTRLLQCGWETGDIAEAGVLSVGANMTGTLVASVPTPSYGTYCLRASVAAGVTTLASNLTGIALDLGANQTSIWTRCHIFLHGLSSSSSGGASTVLMQFKDDLGNVHVSIGHDEFTGALRACRATQNTLLASGGVMTQDAWHLIEVRINTIDDVTGGVEVWLDGTRVINFTGDNRNGGNANVRAILVGWGVGSNTVGLAYVGIDDLAVNETSTSPNNGQIGDGKIIMLVPSGVGDLTQIASRGGTDTGANWSQLNEVPTSNAQYVSDVLGGVGHQDLYAMTNPSGIGTVNAISLVALCQKSDAGAAAIGLTQKNGVTTTEATAQSLPAAWGYRSNIYEVVPGGAAYTVSDLNAIQAGVTIR